MCVVLPHILARGPATRPRCIPPAWCEARHRASSHRQPLRRLTTRGETSPLPLHPIDQGAFVPLWNPDRPYADRLRASLSKLDHDDGRRRPRPAPCRNEWPFHPTQGSLRAPLKNPIDIKGIAAPHDTRSPGFAPSTGTEPYGGCSPFGSSLGQAQVPVDYTDMVATLFASGGSIAAI